MHLGERAERHRVDPLQDGLLHAREGRLAVGDVRLAQHVGVLRQQIGVLLVVLGIKHGLRRHEELHGGERAERGLGPVAREEEIPARALLELAVHRGRPVHYVELGVDAHRLQLLGDHQRRVVHAGVVLIGEQDQRLAVVAGLLQVFLREFLVLDVVGLLAGVGVEGAVRILEPDVQLVGAICRGIHDLVHVERRLHRLPEVEVIRRREGRVR